MEPTVYECRVVDFLGCRICSITVTGDGESQMTVTTESKTKTTDSNYLFTDHIFLTDCNKHERINDSIATCSYCRQRTTNVYCIVLYCLLECSRYPVPVGQISSRLDPVLDLAKMLAPNTIHRIFCLITVVLVNNVHSASAHEYHKIGLAPSRM